MDSSNHFIGLIAGRQIMQYFLDFDQRAGRASWIPTHVIHLLFTAA